MKTFSELRFLTDENISPEVITWLHEQNFDVSDVKSRGLSGASDRYLLGISFPENRVVITHDNDFGQIVHTELVDFIGIIYIKPGHLPPKHIISALEQLIKSPQMFDFPFLLTCVSFPIFKVRLKFFR
jgi:predicted nuclease of predicted toxin-antitoxin system